MAFILSSIYWHTKHDTFTLKQPMTLTNTLTLFNLQITLAPYPSGVPDQDDDDFIVSPNRTYTIGEYRDALNVSARTRTLEIWDDMEPYLRKRIEEGPGTKEWKECC